MQNMPERTRETTETPSSGESTSGPRRTHEILPMTWKEHNSHGHWFESFNPEGYAIVEGDSRFEFDGIKRAKIYALYEQNELVCQRINVEDLRQVAELRAGQYSDPIKQESTAEKDAIRPSHYTELQPEPIDVIESWKLGFHLGNAVKYIARAGRKTSDAITDLEKAVWYLQREIACRKALEAAKREHIGI